MMRYPAYLEIHEDGRCLAHVLELPGLVVRAPSREEALARLPDAVREYHAWLRRHGQLAPPAESPVEVELAGESIGFGPFDRRNRAALFPPDYEPVTPQEMERFFRLLSYSRADLLALVARLSDELLDWKPNPESFSIRELLRHVGNAEEWYVSRLVPPETLPPEWEHDEDLPLCEFLSMERRTAIDRLRQLTEEERSTVMYPTAWAYHPEEPWTARKALRRFVEHEREHTWQVRELLEARRAWLLARLAAERAALLGSLLGLDEGTLTETPITGDWTVLDLLAHVAGWERWVEHILRAMAAGLEPDFQFLRNLDGANAAFVTAWREQAASMGSAEPMTGAVTLLQAGHASLMTWLKDLPLDAFFQSRIYEAGGSAHDWSFDGIPLRILWEHDAEHAAQITAWRKAGQPEHTTGPKTLLLAALDAAREELLACAALIPAADRASRPVCGAWTPQDVLGHIADWEWLGAAGLHDMAAGQDPQVEHVTDIDGWNQAHVEARRGQSWQAVQSDLHAARKAFREALVSVSPDRLGHPFSQPWGGKGSPYQWGRVYFEHDREHARHLYAWEEGS